MTKPIERRIDVRGISTRYLESGDPDAPTLVLLHGGEFGSYATADDWAVLLPRLGEEFHVIAPDLLGCGGTDGPASPEGLLFSEVVAHTVALLDALGVAQAHIVGHSRGGTVATLLALDHPRLAASVVIVGGGTLVTPPNPIYREWAEQAARIIDPVARVRFLVAANSHTDDHIDEEFARRMAEAVSSARAVRIQEQFSAGTVERFHAELAALTTRARERIAAGDLDVPVLVAWGYDDPSARIDDAGKKSMDLFLGHLPDAEMHVFNRAGHYCFRERPDEFAAVLRAFLTAVSRVDVTASHHTDSHVGAEGA